MRISAFALPLAAAVLLSGAAQADHEGRFDFEKTVTLTGTLARVAWSNPRVYLSLDVKDADGKLVQWTLITGGPTQLSKAGIADKANLFIGQTYKVDANPELRPGSARVLFLVSLTLPDGKVIKLGI